MNHLQKYSSRPVRVLPTSELNGWTLKRYGIIAKDKEFDSAIASAAFESAIKRLPTAGKLEDAQGNHGIGFQIVHFADVAVVSPVFYWLWGSVLANTDQMRAQWEEPSNFQTGVNEVVGCLWELQIICFEAQSWKENMLGGTGTPAENLSRYLERSIHSTTTNL